MEEGWPAVFITPEERTMRGETEREEGEREGEGKANERFAWPWNETRCSAGRFMEGGREERKRNSVCLCRRSAAVHGHGDQPLD